MGRTWNNGSQLAKGVTLNKCVTVEKNETLEKMSHCLKSGSHLKMFQSEKWFPLSKMYQRWKNGSELKNVSHLQNCVIVEKRLTLKRGDISPSISPFPALKWGSSTHDIITGPNSVSWGFGTSSYRSDWLLYSS